MNKKSLQELEYELNILKFKRMKINNEIGYVELRIKQFEIDRLRLSHLRIVK